ncbi:MAG: M23 family metallopeptidase [Nitrospiraceae bacterium]|nr:MAG: M23 family metallopeptidase [Nitrospiraceae bacterium]
MDNSSLIKSRFTVLLMQANAADKHGFKAWVFHPGMMFNAQGKWWGDCGRRSRPHEGLDLCLYRNRQNRIVRLTEGTAVPAMFDGVVVKIIDDFLGKSVFIDHSVSGSQPFCSIYGHTIPQPGLEAGCRVKEGDIIAAIADTGRSKTGLLPHLHISLGLLSGKTSYDSMDWETIGNPDIITLIDPIGIIGGDYAIQDSIIHFLPDR